MDFSIDDLQPQLTFKTSRSGGKGGQNVNKVSSKVELNFDFQSCPFFTEDEKKRLKEKLHNRMTADGAVQVVSEAERSQLLNKQRTAEKLMILLKNALKVQKQRKATKPKKSAVEQRLKQKHLQALKKMNRRADW